MTVQAALCRTWSESQIAAFLMQKLNCNSGLPHTMEKSGKLKFFQGQGIVREFCKVSGKLENFGKSRGIVRAF